jgi:hypothetical protein
LDGFHGTGANFTVSTAPPPAPEPEPTKEQPSELRLLQGQLNTLQEQLERQSREASQKISQLVEQNQLLNQSMQDKLRDLSVVPRQYQESNGTAQEPVQDWDAAWKNIWDSGVATPDQPQNTQTEEDVDPRQLQQVVAKTVAKIAEEGNKAHQEALRSEQILIERFNTEAKDLHPHRDKVVALWQKMAQANPQQPMEERYDEVISLARDLFKNTKVSNAPNFPSGGQQGGGSKKSYDEMAPEDPAMIGMSMDDVRTENQRAKALEEYVQARREAQKKRMGYFQIPNA